MQTYQHLVTQLKHSPQLPAAIEELNAFWDAERKRRIQFYADLNEDSKAEFIEGEVVVHSPARDIHNLIVQQLTALVSAYVVSHSLGKVRSEKALIELTRNSFEPDIVFFDRTKDAVINDQTLYYPAPNWVCEVLSSSTERYDRNQKLLDYALHNVSEYLIIDPDKKVAEQYLLGANNEYELAFKSNSGEISFKAIPGLVIPVATLFDEQLHLRAMQQILTTK